VECPKCKAKVGVMQHLIMVETGAVQSVRCLICGFWEPADQAPARQNRQAAVVAR